VTPRATIKPVAQIKTKSSGIARWSITSGSLLLQNLCYASAGL